MNEIEERVEFCILVFFGVNCRLVTSFLLIVLRIQILGRFTLKRLGRSAQKLILFVFLFKPQGLFVYNLGLVFFTCQKLGFFVIFNDIWLKSALFLLYLFVQVLLFLKLC